MTDIRRERYNQALKLAPPTELPFPAVEYQRRQTRLRSEMESHQLQTVFLSSPEAICWLTGDQAEWYQGQSSSQWPPASGVAVNVDCEEWIHFETEDHRPRLAYTSVSRDVRTVRDVARGPSGDLLDFVVQELSREAWLSGTVGVEMGSYRPNPIVSRRWEHAVADSGGRLRDATAVTRELRRLKSPLERSAIRTANSIAHIGLDTLVTGLRAGMTELEAYAEIVSGMARVGGEVAGITLPVLSGAKTLCGHALSSRKVIMPGEIVATDICGVLHRYHANIARTISMGEPSDAIRSQVEKAAGAFRIASDLIRPGLSVNALTAALEAYYRDVGIWDDRWYLGGYELGIAFPPDWVGEWTWGCGEDRGDAVFEPGLVVNMESNVVLPESAGRAMLINTIVVEDDHAEVLGPYEADLIVVA